MASAIKLESSTIAALDAVVASGRFPSHDEAIRTALHIVEECDAEHDEPLTPELKALLEERIAAADADPDGGIPAEQVFAELRHRYQNWT